MLQRLYSVARTTFVETIRQPIYGVILLVTAILMILNVSLAAFTLDNDNKLLLDLGLCTLLLSGLFSAAFCATGILSREIEQRTVLTVISKPISRPVFLLGKFTGLWAALLLAFYLSTLVFVLTLRHGVLQNSSDPWDAPVLVFGFGSVAAALLVGGFTNYFYGWDFLATTIAVFTPTLTGSLLLVGKFDEDWKVIPFGSNYAGGQTYIAAYLVLLVVLIISAVALAASTRFGQVMTLTLCTGVLALGVVADSALGGHAESSRLADVVYRAVPNVGPFWVIDGLLAGKEETTVTMEYCVYTTAYAMLLTTAILSIAVAAFQRREVG